MQIPPKPGIEAMDKMSKEIIEYIISNAPSVAVTKVFDKFSPDFKQTKQLDPCLIHCLAMLEKGKLIMMDNKHKNASLAAFVLLEEDGTPRPYETIDNLYESFTFGNWISTPYDKVCHDMCYEHYQKGFPVKDCAKCEKEILSTICKEHGKPLRRCEKCAAFTTILKNIVSAKDADKWISSHIAETKKRNLEAFKK